jgi:hypothetical protein
MKMIIHAYLSYRHLEDAAMRIGKCLQAYNGGKSILDEMRETPQPIGEEETDYPSGPQGTV